MFGVFFRTTVVTLNQLEEAVMVRIVLFLAGIVMVHLAGGATLLAQQGEGGPKPPTMQYAFKVTCVYPGPASRQGIEKGDIIVSVDQEPVRSGDDLRYLLRKAVRSAKLQVIDCRTGRLQTIRVYPRNGRIGIDGEQVQLPASNGGHGLPPVGARGDRLPPGPSHGR
jgi:membrane-associated protease RseP (regulator of RpoE activity)